MSSLSERYDYPPGAIPPADDNGAPALDDVSDGGRTALFDPDRCAGERGHWIQIDSRFAEDLRRLR